MALQTFTAGQILTAAQQNALQANDYNQTVSNKTANYVLVAADKGTRVVMSNAVATTITVNTGLFNAGDTLFIQNIGAGTCTITAGTATVTTASSLALAQWGGGTLYFTSASAAIFFSGGGAQYGTATGGTSSNITIGGQNYTLLTFTTDGTLTVTKAGLFDYFIVGSGAGSNTPFNGGGGGGAGQLVEGTAYFSTNQTVRIGAGSAYNAFNVGVSSIGNNLWAMCGGGKSDTTGPSRGSSGAGGQGAGSVISGATAFINAVTGYGGGNGSTTGGTPPGGGGGGMGGAGANASGASPGTAGIGVSNSFNSVATTYCRGGFGSTASGGISNAAANTGNGGGNVLDSIGAGGSGLVMVRFKI